MRTDMYRNEIQRLEGTKIIPHNEAVRSKHSGNKLMELVKQWQMKITTRWLFWTLRGTQQISLRQTAWNKSLRLSALSLKIRVYLTLPMEKPGFFLNADILIRKNPDLSVGRVSKKEVRTTKNHVYQYWVAKLKNVYYYLTWKGELSQVCIAFVKF